MTDQKIESGAIVTFAPARRAGSHVLISMEAYSGNGKTYSAILLGRGLVGPQGKLALLDTETGRGKTYANLAGGYDYAELTPPFSPERYIAAIRVAESAGYECLIIDSGSHEWEGIGGLIEIADGGTTKKGDPLSGLAKWAAPKARHKKFMQTLLTTRMHIIICLRSKEKLIQRKGTNGKDEIVSAGWFPVQDKYFPYEMTVRLFFPEGPRKGVPELSKCPADLLGAFPADRQITTQTGEAIAEWVRGGEPVDGDLIELKREAEEAAEGGSDVLGAFWQRLTPDQRNRIKPFGPNLRSIADTADRDAAEQEESSPAEFGRALSNANQFTTDTPSAPSTSNEF